MKTSGRVRPRSQVFVYSLALSGLLMAAPGLARDAYDDEEDQSEGPAPRPEVDEPGEDDGALEAGGLTAPEAMPEQADGRSEVEKELDEADEKDDRRGLEFAWLNLDFGYHGTVLFNRGTLLEEADASNPGGFLFGAAAGVRVLYFTLGGRYRHVWAGGFDVWSALAELGLRVPYGMWEPYVNLGGGYAGVKSLSASSSSEVAGGEIQGVGGFDLRLGGGLDIYLSDSFSVGTDLSADFLFLRRKGDASLCADGVDCLYASQGSGTAAGLAAVATVGLHF